MYLRRSSTPRRLLWTALVAVFWGSLVAGCRRDDTVAVDRNLPPETFITEGPEVSADPRNPVDIFYRAHLYWRGEDRDGRVVGFRYAIDDTLDPGAWGYTEKTDSIFRFQSGEVGSREHLFLIRAVDNLGKQDPTPDTLRFEAFTLAPPVVDYVTDKIRVETTAGTFDGLAKNDTVLVNSSITFVWTGSDADGEVVRWESVFGTEPPVRHARSDTTRTVRSLPTGKHDFLVRAIDDAGAVSQSGGLFSVFSNFDPVTTIDTTAIETTLKITWLDSDPDVDSVVTRQVAPRDTIPFGGTVRFCWTSEDPDGPVVLYFWTAGFLSGSTDKLCLNTDSVAVFNPSTGDTNIVSQPFTAGDTGAGFRFFVQGRDLLGNVETQPKEFRMFVNFPPSVTIDPAPPNITTSTPVQFTFQGFDRDSDPRLLRYRWWFDTELPPGTFTEFPTGTPTTQPRLFAEGTHRLRVQAVDQSGLARPSVIQTLVFDVVP